MTVPPEFRPEFIESQPEWRSALQEIEQFGICGLNLLATGPDPLSHEVGLVLLALPDTEYVANCFELGHDILRDLAWLLENKKIRKVLYDAKFCISFVRASESRKLYAENIFDLLLASQICWSGYYELSPSSSPKNPWKKRAPDHSLAALAERHLGIRLNDVLGKSLLELCSDERIDDLSSESIKSAAMQTAVLLPIHSILEQLIDKNCLQKIADLEFKAISSLAEMEISGIYLDPRGASTILGQRENELCDLVWTMQDEAQRKGFVRVSHDGKRLCYYLNPDKQEDVMAFLRRRGFAVTSTKAEVLRGLAAAGCGFAEAVLRYRHVCQTLSFLKNWMERVHAKDGRVHPQYFQISHIYRQDQLSKAQCPADPKDRRRRACHKEAFYASGQKEVCQG
ncbi:MAG: DNA polymerase I [Methanosaeta sp. PtaU1.Bin016]|jgi:DNA polymerase I-like protein with 3'-5' exonuclease and polymerase domains|nr:MAG: DNA polymerase I [Methanosaeta sp. PtaU1.Bin016]